jgi:hypothetical protein
VSRVPSSAVLLLAAVLLAGCGSDSGGGTQTAATSAAASVASSAASSTEGAAVSDQDEAGTDVSPFPANTEPDTQAASADAQVTVHDIRTGRQDGFDRVVFEVGGTGTPGWDVRYVDQASSQGSGKPIDVAGQAVLQVTITGAQVPDTTGVAEFDGPNPLPGAGTRSVTEVAYDHTFEGTAVAFVGTTAQAPFRVYALSHPTRVVLEVRDAL